MQINDLKKFRQTAEGFSDFDWVFAELMLRHAGQPDNPILFLCCALVARQLTCGFPDLILDEIANTAFPPGDPEAIILPDSKEFYAALNDPAAAEVVDCSCDFTRRTPLVLCDGRLMMRRNIEFERIISEKLRSRCGIFNPHPVMPPQTGSWHPLQKHAIFTGLNSKLLILSGGPGTGKTTVAGQIICEKMKLDPETKIIVTAPTGKAQKQLSAGINNCVAGLPETDLLRRNVENIPGATIHSLLYRKEMYNKLRNCQLLLVDESSMIPLDLFAALLSALPDDASLILAGDRCQLPPIGCGSVFVDICNAGASNTIPPQYSEFFADLPAGVSLPKEEQQALIFTGQLVELTENFRSAQAPAINEISCRLRNFTSLQSEELTTAISNLRSSDFATKNIPPEERKEALKQFFSRKIKMSDGKTYSFFDLPSLAADCSADDIPLLLRLAESYKILCAVNNGPFGVDEFNQLALDMLHLAKPNTPPGTILLITKNDRGTNLSNGDTGVVIRCPKEKICKACFNSCPDRLFELWQLPEYTCGFAITVHKSQGSGFPQVLFAMPEAGSNLNRELLYTAITRSAGYLELWASTASISAALAKSNSGSSRLFQLKA